MIVSYRSVVDYIRIWLYNQAGLRNANGLVVPMTGGVDSCVCGALCLDIRPQIPIHFISMGFKPENENKFEQWATKKFTGSRFQFIKPEHPKLDITNLDVRYAMLGAYVNILSTEKHLLSVGCVTKSEYSLIKAIGPDCFDCYPMVDLYRNEIIELGKSLDVPAELLSAPSILETKLGVSFSDLEWLDRENNQINIINSKEVPSVSKFWGLYSQQKKEVIAKIYSFTKQNMHIDLLEKKMCLVRKAVPGAVS